MAAQALSPTVSRGITEVPLADHESNARKDYDASSKSSGVGIDPEKEHISEPARDDIEAAVSTPPAAPPSPHPYTGVKWYLLLSGLYLTAFLYGLDNTIVADIQGAVISDFGHVEQLTWLGSGFPLGSVAAILLM